LKRAVAEVMDLRFKRLERPAGMLGSLT